MKKLILSVLLLLVGFGASAQTEQGHSEWLTEFAEVSFDGPFRLTLEQVSDSEAPRIIYDTKGAYTSRFRAEVRDGVLVVSERTESRRTTVTEVTVQCHALRRIRVKDVTLMTADTLRGQMLDLVVGGQASVEATLDVTDLQTELSGRSRAVLRGETRYLTLKASTGSVDAAGLGAMAVRAEASNGAVVAVCSSERLEARTSTNARISYAGNPSLIRGGAGFTGGEVSQAQ